MDTNEVLKRLVSIKGNAQARAGREMVKHFEDQYAIKAFLLERGIEQLIMEIQTSFLAEYQSNQTDRSFTS